MFKFFLLIVCVIGLIFFSIAGCLFYSNYSMCKRVDNLTQSDEMKRHIEDWVNVSLPYFRAYNEGKYFGQVLFFEEHKNLPKLDLNLLGLSDYRASVSLELPENTDRDAIVLRLGEGRRYYAILSLKKFEDSKDSTFKVIDTDVICGVVEGE